MGKKRGKGQQKGPDDPNQGKSQQMPSSSSEAPHAVLPSHSRAAFEGQKRSPERGQGDRSSRAPPQEQAPQQWQQAQGRPPQKKPSQYSGPELQSQQQHFKQQQKYRSGRQQQESQGGPSQMQQFSQVEQGQQFQQGKKKSWPRQQQSLPVEPPQGQPLGQAQGGPSQKRPSQYSGPQRAQGGPSQMQQFSQVEQGQQFQQGQKKPWAKQQSSPIESSQGPPLGQAQSEQFHTQIKRPKQQQPQQQQQQQQKPEQVQQRQQIQAGPSSKQLPQRSGDQEISTSLTQVVRSVTDISLIEPKNVVPGRKGRVIQVLTNHIELNLSKVPSNAFHYDVTFEPETPKNMLRLALEQFRREHFPNTYPAFDGRKNLFSVKRLNNHDSLVDTVKVIGPTSDRPREFKITIKFAAEIDLTPLKNIAKTTSPSLQIAVQCLDVVLRNAPSTTCISAGRSFFTRPPRILDLGDGMEMYYGFYQSAVRGWKPFLNVDVAHKAFPKETNCILLIAELLSDYRTSVHPDTLKNRELTRNEYEIIRKFLRTLKVIYEIPNQGGSRRIQRVNDLDKPPATATFKSDDGKTMTVQNYFRDVKKYQLNFPLMPCLWVGAQNREQKILLPIELCTVAPNQVLNRKMNENQTSNMIKYAATSTDVRKEKIMSSLSHTKYNNDLCVREFNLSVGDNFEQLNARVLPPPMLTYAQNKIIKPSRGTWRSDNCRFITASKIQNWTIGVADRFIPKELDKLADMIKMKGRQLGMDVNEPVKPFMQISGRYGLTKQDALKYFENKTNYDLIIVVVPPSGSQYATIKQVAELSVGCLTQCIKTKTINRINPQIVHNILLKVNSKLNGTNHCIEKSIRPWVLNEPCMIMGADVTHPSPDSKNIPSVAAVTASHDPKAFCYNICWRLQLPRVEIIEDLQAITKEQLLFFYNKTNGQKPMRIIFFRDGVSEGQFNQVRHVELTAIKNACASLNRDYQPKITFLVVQKRHHTRLFPVNRNDSEDKNMNVPAGTCVDTVITHPQMQDFYLVSHASIQGVAKPTKYCTLHDDNNLSNDDIEELTYFLCHLFTRCDRSVSYPAPTYYAHLAAARAKVYVENETLNVNDSERLKRDQNRFMIKDSIVKQKPMFFV